MLYFYTPNTFAAAINLFLLPLIALYVYPVRKKALPEGSNGRGTKKS